MTKQTGVHFSKKLLVYFILIMFSISNLSAKRVNVDLKPIEDLLNKFYDVCQASEKKDIYGVQDKENIERLKPLFRTQDNSILGMKLGNCKTDVKQRFASDRDTKLDMTRNIKVTTVITTQYKGVYKAYYSIYNYDKADNGVEREIGIYPIKKSDGTIEWKL